MHSLTHIIDGMARARVLVVGDVMLDVYEHCAVRRISPEAPVPIAQVEEERFFLGGAGNVANNIRALGAQVSLVSVVGDDREGAIIGDLLAAGGIEHAGLVVEPGRVTTLKRRTISGAQQLIRVDREVTEDTTAETGDAARRALSLKIEEHDVVVISDYSKGFFTRDTIEHVREESRRAGKRILVDSKKGDLFRYAGAHLIKPNKAEAESFAGEAFTPDYANLGDIAGRLSRTFNSNILVTLGGDGMALFEEGTLTRLGTNVPHVSDVSGAGDTVLAVVAAAVAAGAPLADAARLSNIAAGYAVSTIGTAVCSAETLRGLLHT